MNKYRVVTFNYGTTQATIVAANNMIDAVNQVNFMEVIKCELVGSMNEFDATEQM